MQPFLALSPRKATVSITVTLALVLLLLSTGIALASTAVTIDYDKFNSSSKTYSYCDKTYSPDAAPYQITIDNDLAYNDSMGGTPKAVITIAPTTTEPTFIIDVAMYNNSVVDVNYKGSKIYGGTWSASQDLILILEPANDDKMKLTIKRGNTVLTSQTLDDRIDCGVIGASGDTDYTTAGSVTVKVTGLTSFTPVINLMIAIIPIIVIIAVLKMLMNTFGKK